MLFTNFKNSQKQVNSKILLYTVILSLILIPQLLAQQSPVDSMIALLDQVKTDSQRVDLLNNIGGTICYSDISQGVIYGQQALELAEKIGYKFGIASAYNTIGIARNMEGKFDLSNEAYFKSSELFKEIKDKDGVAVTYINIAINYNTLAIDSLAIHYNMEAMRLYEELGDSSGIATVVGNLAIIYERHNHKEKALEYYLRAIELSKQIKDFQGLGYTYNNISTFYAAQDELDKSFEYLDLCVELAEKVGDKYLEAIAFLNKGDNYRKMKKFAEAKKNLRKCYDLIEEINSDELRPGYYLTLAEVLLNEGNLKSAEKNIRKSIELSTPIGNKEELKDGYNVLVQILEQQGKYKDAFKAHKTFVAYQDSISSDVQEKKIAEIKFRYETDKKERENEILRHENQLKQETIVYQYFVVGFTFLSLIVTLFFIRALSRNYKKIKTLYDEVNLKNTELAQAIDEINTLRGFIPICASCKKIRNDEGYWEQIENYITKHSDATLTHGLCPECHEELYGEYLRDLERQKKESGN